jgi:uncharacterized protein YjbJ (UPF0337 family)
MHKEAIMTTGTKQKWEGRWDQLAGRAKQFWGWLTDDDLTKVQGDYDRLVGIIKERTGETTEAIEKKLRNA